MNTIHKFIGGLLTILFVCAVSVPAILLALCCSGNLRGVET